MAYAGPKSNTPPPIGLLARAARMLSTKGNRSFNKRLYQHAAKTWLVYLLNELERF